MADYSVAFNFMMDNEDAGLTGVITSDPEPQDPTARARFGLNSHWHPELVDQGFFAYNADATPKVPSDQALTIASNVYKAEYWFPIRGFAIADQGIANKFLDLAVNAGWKEATKIVQRAVNHCLTPVAVGYLPLTVDGACGSETLEAINKCNPGDLLGEIKSYAAQFYRDIAFRLKWPDRQLAAMLSRAAR